MKGLARQGPQGIRDSKHALDRWELGGRTSAEKGGSLLGVQMGGVGV